MQRKDHSVELREWIKTQAWGHHASCTCRIGSDRWQANPSKLTDRFAVLDGLEELHILTVIPETIHHLSLKADVAAGSLGPVAE